MILALCMCDIHTRTHVPVWAGLLDVFMTRACSLRNCSISDLRRRRERKYVSELDAKLDILCGRHAKHIWQIKSWCELDNDVLYEKLSHVGFLQVGDFPLQLLVVCTAGSHSRGDDGVHLENTHLQIKIFTRQCIQFRRHSSFESNTSIFKTEHHWSCKTVISLLTCSPVHQYTPSFSSCSPGPTVYCESFCVFFSESFHHPDWERTTDIFIHCRMTGVFIIALFLGIYLCQRQLVG